MLTNIATTDDLQVLKLELLRGVKEIVDAAVTPQNELLKNKDVKKLLGISTATLQTLRINGTLPFSKIGGTLYYKYSDVIKVFNANKHDVRSSNLCVTHLNLKEVENG